MAGQAGAGAELTAQDLAAEFRAVLELSPADDYAHYALGRCLEKQGQTAEANGHYKLARSLRPGSEIDTHLDAARVPNLLPPGSGVPVAGYTRPIPQLQQTGIFVQGISFGLVFRW